MQIYPLSSRSYATQRVESDPFVPPDLANLLSISGGPLLGSPMVGSGEPVEILPNTPEWSGGVNRLREPEPITGNQLFTFGQRRTAEVFIGVVLSKNNTDSTLDVQVTTSGKVVTAQGLVSDGTNFNAYANVPIVGDRVVVMRTARGNWFWTGTPADRAELESIIQQMINVAGEPTSGLMYDIVRNIINLLEGSDPGGIGEELRDAITNLVDVEVVSRATVTVVPSTSGTFSATLLDSDDTTTKTVYMFADKRSSIDLDDYDLSSGGSLSVGSVVLIGKDLGDDWYILKPIFIEAQGQSTTFRQAITQEVGNDSGIIDVRFPDQFGNINPSDPVTEVFLKADRAAFTLSDYVLSDGSGFATTGTEIYVSQDIFGNWIMVNPTLIRIMKVDLGTTLNLGTSLELNRVKVGVLTNESATDSTVSVGTC